jgi:hypothetical protein
MTQEDVPQTVKESHAEEISRKPHVHGEENTVFAWGYRQDNRVLRWSGVKGGVRDRVQRHYLDPERRHVFTEERLKAGQRQRCRLDELLEFASCLGLGSIIPACRRAPTLLSG